MLTNNRFTGEKPEKEMFQVFNETMRELILEDSRVAYIDADLMGSLKTQDLWHEFPENVFNTGIQEANMVGMACGLYLNGFKPYIHSFAPFASRRVFDQLFLSVAYAGKSVRVIGSDPGIMATMNGGTHMCFEDVAMMRTVPGACIVDVSDAVMCKAFLQQTKDRLGLTYIRMPRRDVPDIYLSDETFAEGKGKILKEGTDVTLIGSGIMVATCLETAKLLEVQGVNAGVVDAVTVKPLDEELLMEISSKSRYLAVVENAAVYGGLGGAVCEFLAKNNPKHVLCIGIEEKFGMVGNAGFLRGEYGLTPEAIADKVLKYINRDKI